MKPERIDGWLSAIAGILNRFNMETLRIQTISHAVVTNQKTIQILSMVNQRQLSIKFGAVCCGDVKTRRINTTAKEESPFAKDG